MTQTLPNLSLAEVLVLLTIREVNERKQTASDAAILSVLEMTPLVTGVDLKCPEVLDIDAIDNICKRLEASGYIADRDEKSAAQAETHLPSDSEAHTLTADEYELCESAVRFTLEVMEQLSREQYEALFELVVCRVVGRWEGWYEDESEVLAMVREKLPSSLAKAEHGQRIAETMREIWDRHGAS